MRIATEVILLMKGTLLCSFIYMIFLSSCVAEKNPGARDNTEIKEKILLLSSELVFSERQQTAVLEFEATVNWTIELINDRASDWCSVKPSSGEAGNASVIVSVNENTDYDNRQAVLLIKAGQCSETVVVSQKQKDALTVTSSRFEISSDGGTVDIEVKSNVNFEYYTTDSAQEWLHDMQTKSLETHHLLFSGDENHETKPRNAAIYIVCGNLMETINIYQNGVTPCIVISDKEHLVESEGGTVTVEVSSNVDVAVELPADADWISESVTRAFSTNKYSFDVMPNTSYDSRTAEIKFSNAENGLCEIVSITQSESGVIILPKEVYEVGPQGGGFTVMIEYTVRFDIEISCDWITTDAKTRTLRPVYIDFEVAANNTTSPREGIITLVSKDKKITESFKVLQKAGTPLTGVTCAPNEILYITDNNTPLELKSYQGFGSSFTDNYYEDGVGHLCFSGNVTEIPIEAFKSRNELVYITIPEGVISIGQEAFSYCSIIKGVNLLCKEVNAYGYHSFMRCAGKLYLNFSPKFPYTQYQATEYGVFYQNSFTEIEFGPDVELIESYNFYESLNLSKVVFGKNLKAIAGNSFGNCYCLTDVYFRGETPPVIVMSPMADRSFWGAPLKHIYVPRQSLELYQDAWPEYKGLIIGYEVSEIF